MTTSFQDWRARLRWLAKRATLLPACDAENAVYWPIPPIARTCCEICTLFERSITWALVVAAIALLLLFAAFRMSADVAALLRPALEAHVGEPNLRALLEAWLRYLAMLLIANALFVIFRSAGTAFLFATYELGRDKAFAVLLLLGAAIAALMLTRVSVVNVAPRDLLIANKGLFALLLGWCFVTTWYKGRYFSGSRRRVFDHDIGAALVRLRWH